MKMFTLFVVDLLNDHLTVHTKTRAYTCYNCDKTFKTTMGLRKHLKSIHKEIKPYVGTDPAKSGGFF